MGCFAFLSNQFKKKKNLDLFNRLHGVIFYIFMSNLPNQLRSLSVRRSGKIFCRVLFSSNVEQPKSLLFLLFFFFHYYFFSSINLVLILQFGLFLNLSVNLYSFIKIIYFGNLYLLQPLNPLMIFIGLWAMLDVGN